MSFVYGIQVSGIAIQTPSSGIGVNVALDISRSDGSQALGGFFTIPYDICGDIALMKGWVIQAGISYWNSLNTSSKYAFPDSFVLIGLESLRNIEVSNITLT